MKCIKCKEEREIYCKSKKLCHRCHTKEWQENNSDKFKNHLKKYYNKNKDKWKTFREYQKRKPNNKELRYKYNKKYYSKNKKYYAIYMKKWRKLNPKKVTARNYAFNHKQRDTKCSLCNSTENLHFHHTNYEKKEGITLCKECHLKIHKEMLK